MTKFYIDQHGCAKNQTDGELLVSYLVKDGFELTLNASEADFIFINSCGFINSAKKESIDAIYSIHNAYPDAKIILTGCLAERYSAELYESIPELSGVFGNGNLSKISDFMKSVKKQERAVCVYEQGKICSTERSVLFNFPASAFVKITEGCSNHCSFCAIPLIRGELRSREPSSIIAEIQTLVKNGVYEINLIGQDLAAYGTGAKDASILDELNSLVKKEALSGSEKKSYSPLALLFMLISKIPGDFIIRLLYIHPDHFNTDILDVIKADSRFVHYFDIPFQSGDDSIIKKMNRTGSAKIYKELIKKIRSALPDCMLRTTFLTGFPGETDEAAYNTQEFLKSIQPDWSGCFSYSREEDTPAYSLKPRVPAKTAALRVSELEEIQSEITTNRLSRFCGKEARVLIEEIIKLDENVAEDSSEGLAIGRGWFQAPEVDGCVVVRYDLDDEAQKNAVKPGNVVNVQILAITGVDLDARFISLYKKFNRGGISFVNQGEE